jgi:cobalt/nickel transport system permease protein
VSQAHPPERRGAGATAPERRGAGATAPERRGAGATATPSWLLSDTVGMCPCGCIGKRTRGSFVEKTLTAGSAVMRQAMFGDDLATAPGLLQRIDARVKLVTMLGLLIIAAEVHNTTVLVGLYVLSLAVAVASRLALWSFVKRVWLFVPVFTAVVVLPATLNIVTSGHVVVPLGSWWFGKPIGVTSQGLQAGALIVTRSAVSISIVVLLTLTTPWAKLMAAMRALLVPRLFIQVLGMAYRYVFLLLGSVDDMYTARRSRMVTAEGGCRTGRAFVTSSAGALFGKAHALSEDVHMAMVSRGYTGDARSIDRFRFGLAELAWVTASIAAAGATIGIDRGIGR